MRHPPSSNRSKRSNRSSPAPETILDPRCSDNGLNGWNGLNWGRKEVEVERSAAVERIERLERV